MIDFGPFKLGQPLFLEDGGYEHFATLDGQPVAVWRFSGTSPELATALAGVVQLQRPLASRRWVRLDQSGVERGAPWLSGELVTGLPLSHLLYRRRNRKPAPPRALPAPIAAGLAITFGRAVIERGELPMTEHEFRASTAFTNAWGMRVQWDGTLRPMFVPTMFSTDPYLGFSGGIELVTPEIAHAGRLRWRAASDVFQVAEFAGVLLRGESLFPERSVEGEVPEVSLSAVLPHVDPELRAVLYQGLVHEPEARTGSVARLIEQLEPFGDEAGAQAWLRDEMALQLADRRHQEHALGELRGRPPEPIPSELEARVLAARNDPAGWLVLGDWLSANGYPRGELVMRHHRQRGNRPVLDHELPAAEGKVLAAIDGFSTLHDLQVYLRYGYADGLTHKEDDSWGVAPRKAPEDRRRFVHVIERQLFQALLTPTFRFLRVVLVDSDSPGLDAVMRALVASRHPGVQEVFVPANRVADVEATLKPGLSGLKTVRACREGSEADRQLLLGYRA
ncbi:MAG: hypothetical protein QM723_09790 [Myxococcaceae bacterium]